MSVPGRAIDAAEMARALDALYEPDQVIEVRAFVQKVPDVGYYYDREALISDVCKRAGRYNGVYTTLQRIKPALIARSVNRIITGGIATSDNDVLAYRWLPLDFDPVRPAGVSSTDEEHQLAIARAEHCRNWLNDQGFDQWILADSGNGAHLLLPTDEDTTKDKVHAFFASMAARFDDDRVKVDQTVFNPARIWKLYGTMARKGDDFCGWGDIVARPHRLSRLLEVHL